MTGTICSVAICKSNSKKAKEKSEKIMFFRFPKAPEIRNEWIRRYYRQDTWSHENKRICSKHFTTDDFEDLLEAKLLNKEPKRLKVTAIPSLSLRPGQKQTETARKKRMLKKQQKKIAGELLMLPSSSLSQSGITESVFEAGPSTQASDENKNQNNLEKQFNELSEAHVKLQKEVEELRRNIINITNRNRELQKLLEDYEKKFEIKVRDALSTLLSPNQQDIVLKAYTLRYFSKTAYIYVRQTLKYPLPGISTLQKWAANIDLKKGLLIAI